MDQHELLAEYLARAESLLAEAVELEHQAEKLRDQREGYLNAAELLRPLLTEDEDDLIGLVVDFTGCANNVDRLVRIGQAAPRKILNTSKVTQYLLDHGQSRSNPKNYYSEISRALSQHPEFFVKVHTGAYRYSGELPALEGISANHGPVEGGHRAQMESMTLNEEVHGPAEGGDGLI